MRCRPLSNKEKSDNNVVVVSMPDACTVSVTDPRFSKSRNFEFDGTFGPDSNQDELFTETKYVELNTYSQQELGTVCC